MAMDDQEQGVLPEQINPIDETGSPADQTTNSVARALDLIDRALVYGYQRFGLHSDTQPQKRAPLPVPGDEGIEDDKDDVQSFANGGVVENDEEPVETAGWRDAAPEGEGSGEWQDAAPEGGAPSPDTDWASRQKQTADNVKGFGDKVAGAISGGVKSVKSLLGLVQGDEAMSKEEAGAAEAEANRRVQQAQAAGKDLSPSDQRLLALQMAAKEDPIRAWGFLQHYRQKFDASRAFAARAMDKDNVTSAVYAANTAFEHALDGSDVSFSPLPRADGGVAGVTALITPKGGSPIKMTMNLDQFRSLLSGPDGSYDSILQRGSSGAVRRVMQAAQAQQPQQGQQADGVFPPAPQRRSTFGPVEQPKLEAVKLGSGRTDLRPVPKPDADRPYTLADQLKEINQATNDPRERGLLRQKAMQEHHKAQVGENKAQIGAGARVQSATITAEAARDRGRMLAQASTDRTLGAAERQQLKLTAQREIEELKQQGSWDRLDAATRQSYERTALLTTSSVKQSAEAAKTHQGIGQRPNAPQGGPAAPVTNAQPSRSDIAYLRSHPDKAAAFDGRFGAGASKRVLEQ